MNLQKPEPRKRTKARKLRVESKVAQRVRAECVTRDGDCRLNYPALWLLFGACSGESEWAHLEDKRRFLTRGMAPEHRHQTEGSLMLCTSHHARYDGRARPRLMIAAVSSHGADGALMVTSGETTYIEPSKQIAEGR